MQRPLALTWVIFWAELRVENEADGTETNTRDMISMSEFSRNPSAVVNDLPAHGHRVIVRNNQPVGVLMSMEEADRFTIVWVIAQRSDDECYELAYSRIPAIGSSGHRDRIRSLLDNAFGRSSGD